MKDEEIDRFWDADVAKTVIWNPRMNTKKEGISV